MSFDALSLTELVLSAAVVVAPAVFAIYTKLENVAQRHEAASQKVVDTITALQASQPQISDIINEAKSVASSLSGSA